MNNTLELRNIKKSFFLKYTNEYVLKGVNAKLEAGKIYGLLAPNGSGKSTLLRTIVNLMNSSGKVTFNNIEVSSAFNNEIALSPAEPMFIDSYTVEDYLSYVCLLKGLNRKETIKKISETELFPKLRIKISELSTGWRKILQIFIENLTNPAVLILDEPFNGLDMDFRKSLKNSLKNFKDKIIILSTHTFSDLEDISTDTLFLKGGITYLESCKDAEELRKAYERYFGSSDKKVI